MVLEIRRSTYLTGAFVGRAPIDTPISKKSRAAKSPAQSLLSARFSSWATSAFERPSTDGRLWMELEHAESVSIRAMRAPENAFHPLVSLHRDCLLDVSTGDINLHFMSHVSGNHKSRQRFAAFAQALWARSSDPVKRTSPSACIAESSRL